MAQHEELIHQVKELIRNNRTGKALELLAKEQLSSLDKDLIILNGQYSKIKDDQRLGVIDDDLAQRRLNKINLHLLDLSEKIGKSSVGNISASLRKKEEKFNKWWIVAPVLLLLTRCSIQPRCSLIVNR
jgi:hypothetical protein